MLVPGLSLALALSAALTPDLTLSVPTPFWGSALALSLVRVLLASALFLILTLALDSALAFSLALALTPAWTLSVPTVLGLGSLSRSSPTGVGCFRP